MEKTDTIYQSYGKDLYRITGSESEQEILDMLSADPSANNSGMLNVPADSIGSGVDVANTEQGYGALSSGQVVYNDSKNGYWLGIDKDGIPKISVGASGGNHMTWDGSTLTVVGTVNIGSLNIPDTTTANSFHVDTNGNTWWGANVATGYTGANAYVLNTGAAVFKNIQMGGTTIQYVITNSGIFSFGDGSDGDVTISVDTTLTADKYYNNLTVNAGITLNPGGYRIFVKGTLTLNGTIGRNGTTGTAGGAGGLTQFAGHTAIAASVTLAAGYLNGAPATGTGGGTPAGSGVPDNGGNGTNTTNSLGSNGVGGSPGGNGKNSIGATQTAAGGGTGGTVTASNVKLIANWHLSTLLDIILVDGTPTGYKRGQTIPFDNSASAGGGGCGGAGQNNNGGQTTTGGGGGAGGTAGGIVAVYARIIIIGAAGAITATGGVGGAGGRGWDGDGTGGGSGGGGGGGGGNGGIIVLIYNSLTNGGSITASAGNGGAAGAPGTDGSGRNGTAGTAGNNGSAGTIYQFQLSL